MPATSDHFSNFASSTLAGGAGGLGTTLAFGDTSLLVATGDGSKFPSTGPFMLALGTLTATGELVKCTARSGDTLTIVRAQEGTGAQNWTTGTKIYCVVTAGSFSDLWTRLQAAPVNVTDYGARGDGVTDDTAALQAALNACPAGGVVLLPPATYATTSPLTIPPQVTLSGMHASHLDSSTCSIKPLAAFSGVAVLLFVDQTTGGYSIASTEQRLSHLYLDCSSLTGTTIDAIQAQGLVHGVVIEDVQAYKAPNHGLSQVTNASGTPYSWRFLRFVANTCGGYGVSWASTDSTFIDCEAIGNGKSGWFLGSCPNSHFVSCRAEWNGFDGFTLSGVWASGTGSGGCTFTGCSTDRNTQNGMLINATGTVPVALANLMCRRDGRNAGTGGGGYAGLHLSGSTLPVTIVNLSVFPGVDDNGTGTNSPQYGFSIGGTTTHAVLVSGYCQGNTAGVTDDGTNTWYRNASVLEASGTTAAPSLAANPRGHGVSQPAVPASTTAQANTTGHDCTVYVTGGTVTAIAIGGTATGLTSGSFRVPMGQTITLTYSVAPTWQWFGE